MLLSFFIEYKVQTLPRVTKSLMQNHRRPSSNISRTAEQHTHWISRIDSSLISNDKIFSLRKIHLHRLSVAVKDYRRVRPCVSKRTAVDSESNDILFRHLEELKMLTDKFRITEMECRMCFAHRNQTADIVEHVTMFSLQSPVDSVYVVRTVI